MDVVFIVANKKGDYNLPERVTAFTDCTMSLDHKFSNDVTEHPVELNGSFTDHVQVKNNRFSLSGMYSNTPLTQYSNDAIVNEDRVQKAYKFLVDLRDSRKLFTLVSKYDVYNNCVVENLSIPVAPDNGTALIFTMDVVQVRIATTDNIRIALVQDVKDEFKDVATPQSSTGRVQGRRNAPPDVDEFNKVYLSQPRVGR